MPPSCGVSAKAQRTLTPAHHGKATHRSWQTVTEAAHVSDVFTAYTEQPTSTVVFQKGTQLHMLLNKNRAGLVCMTCCHKPKFPQTCWWLKASTNASPRAPHDAIVSSRKENAAHGIAIPSKSQPRTGASNLHNAGGCAAEIHVQALLSKAGGEKQALIERISRVEKEEGDYWLQ